MVNGTTKGNVDIYAHDGYPLGFDCANPTTWPSGNLPNYYHASHEEQSPSTLFSLMEFQGGAFDPWGGLVSFHFLKATFYIMAVIITKDILLTYLGFCTMCRVT